MTDRELLEQMYAFFVGRNFVKGDTTSVMDMVKRYQQPPLTMHQRVCAQMTESEYDRFSKLLIRVRHHLKPHEPVEDSIDEPV